MEQDFVLTTEQCADIEKKIRARTRRKIGKIKLLTIPLRNLYGLNTIEKVTTHLNVLKNEAIIKASEKGFNTIKINIVVIILFSNCKLLSSILL